MKTKTIAAWVFALGVLSTGAFAENTTESPAPAPERIAPAPQSPGAGEPARGAATPGPTAKQIAQLEHDDWGRSRRG
jgi:hypothetical protein